jgi:hypothetical protein
MVAVDRAEYRAHLTLRWRGGTLTELDGHFAALPSSRPWHGRRYNLSPAPSCHALVPEGLSETVLNTVISIACILYGVS